MLSQCRKLISLLPPPALDPEFKVVYARHHWGSDDFKAGLKMLEDAVSIIL